MGIFDLFRKKGSGDTALTRREYLMQNGRLTDGVIIDSEPTDDGGELIQYEYWVHGVSFESSEFLTEEQKTNAINYAPGASVGIRFDPRSHGNSIVV